MKCKRCHSEISNFNNNRCSICGFIHSDEEIKAGLANDEKTKKAKKKRIRRIRFWSIFIILCTVFGIIYHKPIIEYVKTEQYKEDYSNFKIELAEKKEQKRIEKEIRQKQELKEKEERARLEKEEEQKRLVEMEQKRIEKEAEDKAKKEQERIEKEAKEKAKREEEIRKQEEQANKKREQMLAKKYKLGALGEGGGVIFYDKGKYSDGWRYLECSVSNLAKDYWVEEYYQHDYISGLQNGLGNGYENTQKILSEFGYNSAAGIAAQYGGGGFDDWYLPNRDEMELIYKVLGKKYFKKAKKVPGWEPVRIGVLGIFTDPYNYWTSELSGAGSAYYVSCEGKFDGEIEETEIYSTDLMFGLVSNPKELIRAIRRF